MALGVGLAAIQLAEHNWRFENHRFLVHHTFSEQVRILLQRIPCVL
jgi:hypothetical protein